MLQRSHLGMGFCSRGASGNLLGGPWIKYYLRRADYTKNHVRIFSISHGPFLY